MLNIIFIYAMIEEAFHKFILLYDLKMIILQLLQLIIKKRLNKKDFSVKLN